MHSIERYGIVTLLFLVVTVVAVLMWDGGKGKKKDSLAGAAANAPVAAHERPGAEERRARRLALAAEPQPGPLVRAPIRSESESAADLGPPQAAIEPVSGAPLDLGTAENRAPAASAPPATLSPREQPSRDPIVGKAPSASTHAYTVRSGDTLSEIAQHELGSAKRWPEIVAANPGLDPAKLRAGKPIQIPGAGTASAARADSAPAKPASSATDEGRTWKVGKGENLWKIAEQALGDGKRWKEIAALNPRANPDRLVLGQVLRLPGSASSKKAPAKTKPAGERTPLVASTAADRDAQRGGRVR
jgi:nucleoid-associated protein YgaU